MNGTWKTTGPGRGTWQASGSKAPAAAAVAAVAACVAVLRAVVPLVPAITVTILGACALGTVATARLMWHGRVRRPAALPAPATQPAAARAAITAPPRAIEAAPRAGVRVTLSATEHMREMR
jgi:hypothetical protein